MLERFMNLNYIDLFSNYEEYHAHVDTYLKIRAIEISKWIDEGATVLDVGCGDGKNSLIMKEQKQLLIEGIDLVDKAKGIIPVIKRDLNTDGLCKNRQYDFIVLCEVLEHLLHPHEILIQSANIAKKGVIVAIPNSAYFIYRLQLCLGYFPRQSFTHIHFWSLKDFIIFCQQLGLSILKVKVNQSKNILKSFLKRILPNLFAYQLYFYITPLKNQCNQQKK
jgi:methionine biosynthesis protein MetW